jgi:DNA-binding response OmpR family regulator
LFILGKKTVRKRRAIIFDDDPLVLSMFESFLKLRGYEVFSFSEPVVCPIFGHNEGHCRNEDPCADVMISDFRMPGMNGLELLQRQRERGCRLDIRNKAIISGVHYGWDAKIEQLGCAFFRKPCHLAELSEWIRSCEERMPLSAAIGTRRKESREPVLLDITYFLPYQERQLDGVVTNISSSGFCLTTAQDLPQEKVIVVNGNLPISRREAAVRWTKKLADASYMAGFRFCSDIPSPVTGTGFPKI